MQQHLSTSATEIHRGKLLDLHERAKDLAMIFVPILLEDESAFLNEGIEMRAIPTPKLLIKDHKE